MEEVCIGSQGLQRTSLFEEKDEDKKNKKKSLTLARTWENPLFTGSP
jgi:hypothetical protein